ncbi:TlpA disulfide reductase family protein [Mycolicibacterium mucogenicum]|uniref:Thioredoxin n=1 Tax=Mycolicibacterium aubagnense TaxID=319707 RepID=A0ABM7IN15_9MYCO|nr:MULTISPECIES: TlpA disulfide reductase family protein [Mycolicibacterium]MCX8557083.1 TlpA disulfide reductase family protein [Mycolicibacterium mucogenicum]MCX8564728.1 TlpA disulfide reductase family protein [Mycolicibacterium mucogenicum]RUP29171.1 MAG: TlpA family protein disulfide reductase [Mycolicibacterium sp.]TLH62741.1 TlpA family protein disulfide reductase [Mycolicibacterium aubagnense]BBX88123.1 thioredoxin [Mycolicibacterium aubagnense]
MLNRLRVRALAVVLAGVPILAGCSIGTDAVAQGGTFEFVSPGGKTDIFYDPPPSRRVIGDLGGIALMDYRPIAVSDFAGKVVVVNVWGAWCAPCRTETPELEKVFTATEPLGVAFLGVDVRDNRATAQDFVTDRHVMHPSIFDPAMRSVIALGKGYPTSVVPTTLILDRHRRVAAVFLKELLATDLQPVVERIAAES